MSLSPRFVLGDLDLTDYPFAVEWGSDLGNPANAAEVVDSLLQDGEIISSTRSSNRSIVLPVLIEGSDLRLLAEAEASLLAETEKQRNSLTVDPGDGYAPSTTFITFRAQVEFARDDDEELAGMRRYVLTIPALPFGQSAAEVVTPALFSGGTPTTVTIADGTSATGWTSPYGSVTLNSGALLMPSSALPWAKAPNPPRDFWYVEAVLSLAPVDFSATPYLTLEVSKKEAWQSKLYVPDVYVDGVQLARLAVATIAGGALRCTYVCTDTSTTTLRVVSPTETLRASDGTPRSAAVRLDNVTRSNQAPLSSTTGREAVRTIDIGGSARTDGSLALGATTGLGDVLIYTCPALATGYTPDLRRWRASGSTPVADTSTVSGYREPAGEFTPLFEVPASILPRGTYAVLARLRSGSGATETATVGVSAWTGFAGSTAQLGREEVRAPATQFTTSWSLMTLGAVTLPPNDVADASAAVVKIQFRSDNNLLECDEMWIFYLGEDAALTQVATGAGTPAAGSVHSNLWVDAPSVDSPAPQVLVGTLDDRSDAIHAGGFAAAWGVHSFTPGTMNAFVVTTGAANPALSLRHYPRWHTHAAS